MCSKHVLQSRTQLLVLVERLLLTNLEALGLLCAEIVVVIGHGCCLKMWVSFKQVEVCFQRVLALWGESSMSLLLKRSLDSSGAYQLGISPPNRQGPLAQAPGDYDAGPFSFQLLGHFPSVCCCSWNLKAK